MTSSFQHISPHFAIFQTQAFNLEFLFGRSKKKLTHRKLHRRCVCLCLQRAKKKKNFTTKRDRIPYTRIASTLRFTLTHKRTHAEADTHHNINAVAPPHPIHHIHRVVFPCTPTQNSNTVEFSLADKQVNTAHRSVRRAESGKRWCLSACGTERSERIPPAQPINSSVCGSLSVRLVTYYSKKLWTAFNHVVVNSIRSYKEAFWSIWKGFCIFVVVVACVHWN